MSEIEKIGRYQDDISDVDNLSIERYERLFKVYTSTKNDKDFYFYNILNKIDIPDNIDSTLVDFYITNSKESLTFISHKIYNNITSWWIIYLLNKKLIGNKWFVTPGTQLKYILPDRLDLVFLDITDATVFDNRHF